MSSSSPLKALLTLPPAALELLPGLEPPPGVQSNFTNPLSRGHILVTVSSVLFALTTVFFAIRVYAKVRLMRKLSWDDFTCTLGFIGVAVVYIATVMGATVGPMGKHQWDITAADLLQTKACIIAYIALVSPPPSLGFMKATLFLLHLEIFWPMKWMRFCSFVGLVLSSGFYIAVTTIQFYFATPRNKESWQASLISPRVRILSVPMSCVGLAIDVWLFVLPLVAVSRLKLERSQKIGAGLIFASGSLACVGSILSIYYRVLANKSADITWHILNVQIMTMVEMCIGIIVACMPSFAKVMRYYLPPLETVTSRLPSSLLSRKHPKFPNDRRRGRVFSVIPLDIVESKTDEQPYHDLESGQSRVSRTSKDIELQLVQTKSGTIYGRACQNATSDDDNVRLTKEEM